MTIGFFTHSDMLDHRPGDGHPECPERLAAVTGAIGDASDLDLETHEAPLAESADLALVHPEAYVQAVFDAAPASGLAFMTPTPPCRPAA